jgi:ubiquinone/menaquinone biosynthesis C-methylase UbiE
VTHGFQLSGQGPQAYERYLVPRFFAACAEQLVDLAAVAPGERVLDVACGTGIVARQAADRIGAAGTVVGVDINDTMLAVASAVTDAVTWRSADARAVPFLDAAFDVVCCQQGLQFFSDPPLALREAHRVLRPGGRIALAVWRSIEHHPVFEMLVEALDQHVTAEAADMMRSPFDGPDSDGLRRLLKDAGFDDPMIRIGVIAVRFPSAREFLRQEAVSSPLAGPVGALDDGRREALITQLDRTLVPYMDDDGVVFPMQTWLVRAAR